MPVAKQWAYFDHAAVAPLPRRCQQAITTWAEEAATCGDTVWPAWHRGVERARTLAAGLLGAQPSEIALVPSTTAGITLVAEGLPWQEGDSIVTLENEFPSNVYPWMNLAARGVEVRRLPAAAAASPAKILQACDSTTRLVTLSWVGYASGHRLALGEMAEALRARNILFFLDAIQGLGVFPLDVTSVPIDFLAADGHKWLLGPEGAGICYIRTERLEDLRPTGIGWNSVQHCYDFSRIDLDLKPSAGRFEGGTLNTAGFLGLAASLELLIESGLSATRSALVARLQYLTNYAVERLTSRGAILVSPRTPAHWSGIVSFQLPGHDPDAVRKRCLAAGVVLSCRDGCLRISPHAYNNEQDVDRLLDALGSS